MANIISNIITTALEKIANKANNLNADGTNTKYPTVTAVRTHTTDTANPHGVTKAQVGLSNADNTSDASKPISTATQTALDGKQDTLTAGTNITIVGNTISASGGSPAPSVIIPMLDGLTNVATAYGVKRLKTGSHKAFRLRRATDNVESDFHFGYNGLVNVSEISNFLYGDRGHVVTWYDQSGNNNHATQSTPALQPIVVIQNGELMVMFENNANGLTGQMLSYTLGTPINVRNTTVFSAYESFVGSGQDLLPVPSFTKRYLLSSQNQKLDLYINSNNAGATDYDFLELFSGSAKTNKSLFAYSSANYFSINSNATELKIESNFSSETLTAVASTTETGFAIGNKYTGQGTPFAGSFYSFIQFDTSQSQAVIDKLKEDSKEQFYVIDPSESNINIVCEGDSLTNGLGATFNQNYARQMSSTLRSPLITTATSGATITNLTTRKNRVDNNIKAGKTNILVVWAGTNDMYNEGVSETNAYNSLVAYAQARKTAGFDKVYVLTCIARVSTIKSTFNSLIVANTTDFDGVIDVAKDPRFQVKTAPFNTVDFTYYNDDRIHLSNAGYRAVSSMVDPYISSSISTFDNSLPTEVRLEKVESNLKSFISNFIGAGKDIIKGAIVSVRTAIYSPKLIGSSEPLATLVIRGTDTPSLNNQGKTIIEPESGKFAFGISNPVNSWVMARGLNDPNGNDFTPIFLNNNASSHVKLHFANFDSSNENLMYGYVGYHKTRGMGVRSIGNLNFDFGQSGGKVTFSHFDTVVGAFTSATGTNTRFQLYDNATGTLKDVKYYLDGSNRKILYID
jgi:lysophospholipase L1-like esterase